MRRRTVGLAIALMFVSGALYPCGGPDIVDITAPLIPISGMANRILYPYDGFESNVREEIRFFSALRLLDSARYAPADDASLNIGVTDSGSTRSGFQPVPAAELQRAIAANDRAAAAAAARSVVAAVLDRPAPIAITDSAALRQAVELLDFLPTLDAAPQAPIAAVIASSGAEVRRLTHSGLASWIAAHPASPRAASVRALALRLAYAERVPNGWVEDIRKAVPPAVWDSLLMQHDAWLHTYPMHPLAPFVRLAKVRLWYFADNRSAAWHELFALQADYPRRVSYDMRYLLRQGFLPPDGVLTDATVPPVLRAALVGNLAPTHAEWPVLWRMAEQHRAERWSANLEERLLAATAGDSTWAGALPAEMPKYRTEASLFWRQMWAISQLHANRATEALMLESAPFVPDSAGVSSLIATRAHLRLHQWSSALTVPGLEVGARRYLLAVMAPDSALMRARSSADAVLRRQIDETIAARQATAGRWTAATATAAGISPKRGAAYRQAATLAADSSASGRLAYARWLRQKSAAIFAPGDVVWYRSVSWRWRNVTDSASSAALPPDLPWTAPEEARAIAAHFEATFEGYHALRAYREYFERSSPQDPARRAAVAEANGVYRKLVDFGRTGDTYWDSVLPGSAEARAIRQAGRQAGE